MKVYDCLTIYSWVVILVICLINSWLKYRIAFQTKKERAHRQCNYSENLPSRLIKSPACKTSNSCQ